MISKIELEIRSRMLNKILFILSTSQKELLNKVAVCLEGVGKYSCSEKFGLRGRNF